MSKSAFTPYIGKERSMLELSVTAIIVGLLLAVVFGAANAYLGLRVGMTISASIPAAVISMGVIRVLLRRNSILENNMVQTIGSAGESLAAGCIFTMPALFMWAKEWGTQEPSVLMISTVAFCGGILGVVFMIPLRQALIVKEHGVLPYPEGEACSTVLMAGEALDDKSKGGAKASKVFIGVGLAAVYKFIADGLKVFPSEIHYESQNFRGAGFGGDILPALLGVGYICGGRVCSYLFAGGVLGWLVLMPCIIYFAGDNVLVMANKAASSMDSWGIWSTNIRYIGAGALVFGGIISLVKSFPLIVKTFAKSINSFSFKADGADRTARDLPVTFVLGGALLVALIIFATPFIDVGLSGIVLILLVSFFFVTVSSRMVGIVGSSNNPVSGMTIASVLFTALVMVISGASGHEAMVTVVAIGSIVCVSAAMAGDTSQDLKTGYILGATPYKQQIGEVIGVAVSAVTIAGVLYLLNTAWGFGSKELAAPQATLIKLVTEGVFAENLPWDLIMIGMAIAMVIEILRIPVLPFAIGLYLPVHMTSVMMVGGLLREIYILVNKKHERKEVEENGVLVASGLIAGEGILGILLAVFAVVGLDFDLSSFADIGQLGGIAAFAILVVLFHFFCKCKRKNS